VLKYFFIIIIEKLQVLETICLIKDPTLVFLRGLNDDIIL